MDIIDKLAEVFKEFPGIGERQARRFVYFLMYKNPTYSENLRDLISELKKDVAQCQECFRFFILGNKKEKLCDICANTNIDFSILMVVEKENKKRREKFKRDNSSVFFEPTRRSYGFVCERANQRSSRKAKSKNLLARQRPLHRHRTRIFRQRYAQKCIKK